MADVRRPPPSRFGQGGYTNRQVAHPRLPSASQLIREAKKAEPIWKNPLGKAVDGGKPFGFTSADRMNHMHILGGTGSGKSRFLELLLRQDVLRGDCGLCLLDPHGSLYEETVHFVSHKAPHLADRVILFDPNDHGFDLLGFNPIPKLEHENQVNAAAELMLDALLKSLGQGKVTDTPRIQRWGENIFHTLIRNAATLLEAEAFIDPDAKEDRSILMESVANPLVKADVRQFEKLQYQKKTETIEGFTNRIRNLISDPTMRAILGRNTATIDFDQVLDQKKIVLVSLASKEDGISPRSMDLLGMMIIQSVIRSAKRRKANDPKDAPFFLYADEFSRLITPTVADGLAETRKFKLFFTLAHQDLTQLEEEDPKLAGLIQGNTATKVVFGRLNINDADFMARQMMTGYLDLKTLKHQHYTWAFWPVEETRTVKSKSAALAQSENVVNAEGRTEADSWSRAFSEGRTTMSSTSSGIGSGSGGSVGQTLIPTPDGIVIHDSSNTSNNFNEFSGQSSGVAKASSETNSTGGSTSRSTSQAIGTGRTEVNGTSEAVVPFTKMLPYRQASAPVFYTVDEMIHMAAGQIKNNGVGQAYIIAPSSHPEPCRVQIKDVADVRLDEQVSPIWIEDFKKKSIAAHQSWYLSPQQVEDDIVQRQMNLFGRVDAVIEHHSEPDAPPAPIARAKSPFSNK